MKIFVLVIKMGQLDLLNAESKRVNLWILLVGPFFPNGFFISCDFLNQFLASSTILMCFKCFFFFLISFYLSNNSIIIISERGGLES